MYFFEGMTYEEIVEREKCKHPAVLKSVKAALEKLRIILKNRVTIFLLSEETYVENSNIISAVNVGLLPK